MSAAEKFTFQTRPTPEQRQALAADHAKRYARQYRDNQDAAIAEMQAARLRYEARVDRAPDEVAAAGVACCDVEPEAPVTLPEFVLITAKGLVCIACWLAIGLGLLWLCDVAGQYFGCSV